jgi:hypothetical protein
VGPKIIGRRKNEKETPPQTRRIKPENEKSCRLFLTASSLHFLDGKMSVLGKK